MKKINDIEDLFQQSFEQFEVPVPPNLKDKIDQKLHFKSKRKFAWIWWSAIVAILLISGIYLNSSSDSIQKTNQTSQVSQNNKQHQDLETVKPKKEQNKISKQGENNENKNSKSTLLQIGTSSEKTTITKNEPSNQVNTQNSSKAIKKNKSKNSEKMKTDFSKNENRNLPEKMGNSSSSNKETQNGNTEKSIVSNNSTENNNKTNKQTGEISITNKTEVQVENDSLNLSENQDSKTTDSIQKENISQNDISLPQAFNRFLFTLKSDYLTPLSANKNFKTQNAFQFQAEASYFLTKNIGINSGVNYFTSMNRYHETTTKKDSTFTGNTIDYTYSDSTSYFYDTMGVITDSIVYTYTSDSTMTPNYAYNETQTENSSFYTVNSISIPFSFHYQQKLTSKLYLDLLAGGILSYQQIKFLDKSNPLNSTLRLNQFGFKAAVKTSLRYQFNKFGVCLNNTLLIDFSPSMPQNSKRKEISYGFGVGMSWRM